MRDNPNACDGQPRRGHRKDTLSRKMALQNSCPQVSTALKRVLEEDQFYSPSHDIEISINLRVSVRVARFPSKASPDIPAIGPGLAVGRSRTASEVGIWRREEKVRLACWADLWIVWVARPVPVSIEAVSSLPSQELMGEEWWRRRYWHPSLQETSVVCFFACWRYLR